jgi:hypothetical protein
LVVIVTMVMMGMQGFFVDDAIVYCVLGVRVADEAGGSEYKTTKYVFISWVGPNVKPLTKARSSQVRIALYKHTKVYLCLHHRLRRRPLHDGVID